MSKGYRIPNVFLTPMAVADMKPRRVSKKVTYECWRCRKRTKHLVWMRGDRIVKCMCVRCGR